MPAVDWLIIGSAFTSWQHIQRQTLGYYAAHLFLLCALLIAVCFMLDMSYSNLSKYHTALETRDGNEVRPKEDGLYE